MFEFLFMLYTVQYSLNDLTFFPLQYIIFKIQILVIKLYLTHLAYFHESCSRLNINIH